VREVKDMPALIVHDMTAAEEYFVGTCSHVGEDAEHDASGARRLAWLKARVPLGLRVKVALTDGEPAGMAYVIPAEHCPWGPAAPDLMALPCLFVLKKAKGLGLGRALVAAAEEEARRQGRKGLVTYAYYHDFWFMPAPFFERMGFTAAARRGAEAVMWKAWDEATRPPAFPETEYKFVAAPGKVVVDLFFNTFCATSDIEARRVRGVARSFGDAVVLRERSIDDGAGLCAAGRARGVFVNGREIFWGYEAPEEGIRAAIAEALASK